MIKLENVSFSYNKDKKILKDINLDIGEGEFILFLGESGSGKTTLTRIINSLIPNFFEGDFEGDVYISGKSTKKLTMVDLSSMIGSIFQNPRNQFFTLDTTSEIAFSLENQGIDPQEIKKRVFDIFKDLNIGHLKDKDLYKLSGGQMQMIAIASVCALKPKVIILDEPSANLDKLGISNLVNILNILKKNKTTIIISEHRIYYLKDLITRAIYIKNGEIKNDLTKDQLFSMDEYSRLKYFLRSLTNVNIILKNKAIESKKNLLQIKNLSVGYKEKLLDKINLNLYSGEVLGLIGSNGSGKSTFLNTLSGLNKEISGEIILNNKKLNKKMRLKKCALVMQEPAYQFFMESVNKELSMGIKDYTENEINKKLSKMNLMKKKETNPLKLSGGEKQRLAILINLLDDKSIFLFDEPSSGLDYRNMMNIANQIKKLQERDKIIIIVSHDYELLSEVCTRIISIEDGIMVELQ